MTPAQLRALANLCDALTECEQAGMPVVEDDGHTLTARLGIGVKSYGGQHQWERSSLTAARDPFNGGWKVDR